jgi:NADPH2 dehydrogenase/N-ethylmaleimide reductase
MNPLLQPLTLGDLSLRNRIVMAPMTRNRAAPDGVPGEAMARYYSQRAGAGLIVAEGTWPCAEGQAYCRQPGIATPAQVAGWRRVTDAVHAAGGLIVLQLMHGGRIGSRHIKPAGVATLAPSALQAAGEVWTDAAGLQPYDTPQEMSAEQVRQALQALGDAAARAMEAGFDGVELHGTSGYLPMQFLSSATNRRTDEWGGPAAARAGFMTACLRAMGQAAGLGRVGLRLNPGNTFNDTADEDSAATHAEAVRQAALLGIGWLHMMRAPVPQIDAFAMARQHFSGPVIVNDGFSPETAAAAVDSGMAQAVGFARHFIGNPDLVERIRQGWPLARFDRKTLYTPGEAGYADYPPYAAA